MISGWWCRNRIFVASSFVATMLFLFKQLGDGII